MTDVDFLVQKARREAARGQAGFLSKLPLEKLCCRVDYSLLKPGCTDDQIASLCQEALEFHFASVCLPSTAIPLAQEHLKGTGVRISTVAGFPLGSSPLSTKVDEIHFALGLGAHEVETVLNITDIREGRKEKTREELSVLRRETRGRTLKVIIETPLLTHEEIVSVTRMASHAGVDYIKSNTGFFDHVECVHIALMKAAASSTLEIKAAGGIHTPQQVQTLCALGASRIGTSEGAAIFAPLKKKYGSSSK